MEIKKAEIAIRKALTVILMAVTTQMCANVIMPQTAEASPIREAKVKIDTTHIEDRSKTIRDNAKRGVMKPGNEVKPLFNTSIDLSRFSINKILTFLKFAFWAIIAVISFFAIAKLLEKIADKGFQIGTNNTKGIKAILREIWNLTRSLSLRELLPKWRAKKPKQTTDGSIAAEAMTEKNFDSDFAEATRAEDFRLAIRHTYTNALRELSAAKITILAEGKTTTEYLTEVDAHNKEAYASMRALTNIFLKADYAKSDVNADMAMAAKACMEETISKIRTSEKRGTRPGGTAAMVTATLMMAMALSSCTNENTQECNWEATLSLNGTNIASNRFEPLGQWHFVDFAREITPPGNEDFAEDTTTYYYDFASKQSAMMLACTTFDTVSVHSMMIAYRLKKYGHTMLTAERLTIVDDQETMAEEIFDGERYDAKRLIEDAKDGELEMGEISCGNIKWRFPKEMMGCHIRMDALQKIQSHLTTMPINKEYRGRSTGAVSKIGKLKSEVLATADGKPVCVRLTAKNGNRLTICSIPLLFTDYAILNDGAHMAPLTYALMDEAGLRKQDLDIKTRGRNGHTICETHINKNAFEKKAAQKNQTEEVPSLIWTLMLTVITAIVCLKMTRPTPAIRTVERAENRTLDLLRHTANAYERADSRELRQVGQKRWVAFRDHIREKTHLDIPEKNMTRDEANTLANVIVAHIATHKSAPRLTADYVADSLMYVSEACTEYNSEFTAKTLAKVVDIMDELTL